MLDVAVIRERAYLLADSVDPRVGQHVHGWLDYYDGGKGRRPASSGQTTTNPPQPRRPKGVPCRGVGTSQPSRGRRLALTRIRR